MSEASEFDFPQQVDLLADCREPLLIGVRHHSAAITRSLAPLLNAFQPQCILLEMPSDFTDWIEHLADEQTVAPVAISAADPHGNISFYPLADFSPELAAIRWASKNRVPIVPFDLSAGAQVLESKRERLQQAIDTWMETQQASLSHFHSSATTTMLHDLLARTHSEDTAQLWERLIETPGMLENPESVRRAALLFGWAVRASSSNIQARDLLRESAMRQTIRGAPQHSVALIGSFHASVLLPPVLAASKEHDQFVLDLIQDDMQAVGVSLIGYSFEQLDERSGYPAGIRDPVWHDRIASSDNVDQMDAVASKLVVDICRAIRSRGHVAGTPDATEIIRMMRDLAKIRGLPIAGRGELIESIQSCLVHGELHGRAREVARAIESVLIGNRKGKVTENVPRCGLALAMDEVFRVLKLPTTEVKEIRLDVLRHARDRARAVVLRQLCVANVPYARRVDTIEQGNRENLVEVWEAGFRQGSSATIESVSRYGVTLSQVVEGILQLRSPREVSDEWTPKLLLQQFATASECGLHGLTRRAIEQLAGPFLMSAGLSELVEAASRIGRISAGHVPGLPQLDQEEFPPFLTYFHCDLWLDRLVLLIRTSLDRLSGLVGSNKASDVVGLCELGHWLRGSVQAIVLMASALKSSDDRQMDVLHQGLPQLISWCRQSLNCGSDRMRGAAIGMLCLLHESTSTDLSSLMVGWIDDARDQVTRSRLKDALAGAIQVLLPMMQSETEWLSGVHDCLQSINDDAFLKRLPALRGAFHEFSPTDRQRILDVQLELITDRGAELSLGNLSDEESIDVTETLATLREADLAGQAAVQAMFPNLNINLTDTPQNDSSVGNKSTPSPTAGSNPFISIADRWRMVMGVPPEPRSGGSQAARSLDHLYGEGRGEGARAGLSKRRAGSGGGTEQPVPTAAEWAEDLEALFGSDICQEVLGTSAASGNLGALTALDPDTVVPSMELLQQVLSLAGGTSETKTQRLRQIAKRITEQLAQKLAVRLRPHIHGLSIARPTRRRNRRLNLARTIRGNLANAVRREDGRTSIVAKDLIFNSASKREMDWHLTFVVDVSGSMTSSVVYSALCAAIFAELPALSIRFLAFSTQVIDLSDHVTDPLTLLLEVQVGGGTHIGLGLRHARAGLRVPSRSMVVLVTDFEEGVSLGEMIVETRALVESGVKCLGLAALDDQGVARFHQGCAQMMASAGMPVAAVSPEKLAQWVGDQIRGA